MERVKIEVSSRENVGKESAKKIRFRGEIPAVIYAKDVNVSVTVPSASLKILNSIHFSESAVIDLELINGSKKDSIPVIIKGVQYHPLTEKVIHVDFMKVSLTEKICVNVPIELKGEPPAVKEGCTLNQILRDLEIEGLPLDIPEKIEVDVSALEVGHSVHVKDITVAGNLEVITSLEETIATLTAKVEEIPEEEAEVAAEEAPEGPEVIKEKKEEGAPEEGKKEQGKKEQEKKE